MSLEKKFKTALDETRLLMLGSQIFFGFQFSGIFQSAFDTLPVRAKWLDAAALILMTVTLGCLIAPSARHRIAEGGQVDYGVFRATTIFAGVARWIQIHTRYAAPGVPWRPSPSDRVRKAY